MPQSPELQSGRVMRPEVVLAADIDLGDLIARTGAVIWQVKGVAGEKSAIREVRFPQEGTTLFVGVGHDKIIRFPYQLPKRRFQRRDPQPVQRSMSVDALIHNDRNPGTVTFVHHRRNMFSATTEIDKVVLKPGQKTQHETVRMSGNGQLLPEDATTILAIQDSIPTLGE